MGQINYSLIYLLKLAPALNNNAGKYDVAIYKRIAIGCWSQTAWKKRYVEQPITVRLPRVFVDPEGERIWDRK